MKCFFVVALLFSINCQSQDYTAYQRVFNQTDEDLLAGNPTVALHRLDTIYSHYSFIYANHCFKALQLSCTVGDSIRAAQWMERCIKQGVPLWAFRSNEITRMVLGNESIAGVIRNFDSLHRIYLSGINLSLAATIDSLIVIDQRRTERVNNAFFLWRYTYHYPRWLRNNKRQFAILNKIIDEYGFPGERLIGLPPAVNDSAQASKNFTFYGPNLANMEAYIMLIHYYSGKHEDINEKLLLNVKNGYLPANQYAGLNDFLGRWGLKKYNNYYYNSWHKDENTDHLPQIEQRRQAIGLNTIAQQERNALLEREKRKNKLANSSVKAE